MANVPKLSELMLNYVYENREFVGGTVMARLLFHLFKVGYEPAVAGSESTKQLDLEPFVTILIRDFNTTPAYSIVKACIALYFYRALPIELMTRLFSMSFIDRLEKEMHQNYDTVRILITVITENELFLITSIFFLIQTQITYPKDILFLILQLNRSACLEYPEASIPWLQQKFVDSQLSTRKFRLLTCLYCF